MSLRIKFTVLILGRGQRELLATVMRLNRGISRLKCFDSGRTPIRKSTKYLVSKLFIKWDLVATTAISDVGPTQQP